MGGKGQTPFLTPEQQAEVADEVAAEIREWIEQTYGVTSSAGGLYHVLARLKCGPKVPRPLHLKTDAAAQAAWKKGASSRRSRGRV